MQSEHVCAVNTQVIYLLYVYRRGNMTAGDRENNYVIIREEQCEFAGVTEDVSGRVSALEK